MKLHFSLCSLLLLLFVSLQAQDIKRDNAIWHFGDRTGIRFVFPNNGDPIYPEVIDYSPIRSGTRESATYVEFVDGQAEYITTSDGIKVFRDDESEIGELLTFGSDRGLEHPIDSDTALNALLLPMPQRDSMYMHIGGTMPWAQRSASYGLRINYDVNTKTTDYFGRGQGHFIYPFGTEHMTTAKGKCGNMWILTHVVNDSHIETLYSLFPDFKRFRLAHYIAVRVEFLANDSLLMRGQDIGVGGYPNTHFEVFTEIGQEFTTDRHAFGKMRMSQDDEYFALASIVGIIDLGDFNRASGKVDELIQIDTMASLPYGVCFSPNDQYLYVTESDSIGPSDYMTTIYQYDVSVKELAAIRQSKTPIATFPNETYEVNLQITPHDQIYIGREGKNYLSAITRPDERGMASAFVEVGIDLETHIYRGPALHSLMKRPDDVVPDRDFVFLPEDTTLCNGQVLTVTPDGPDNEVCIWSTCETTQSIDITESDTYWVQVTQNDQCILKDTIVVSYKSNPVPDIGNDTTICVGDTLHIEVELSGATFVWSDGDIDDNIEITEPGAYWVDADIDDCTVRDSIVVDYMDGVVPDLGQDTILCEGSNIVLIPDLDNAAYTWQDNSSDSTYTVEESGIYWVESEVDGCRAIDSIVVEFATIPVFTLGNDTILCAEVEIDLSTTVIDADYLWNDGSNEQTINVINEGTYWLELDREGCTYRDSIMITYKANDLLELGSDRSLCEGDTLLLVPDDDFDSYLWSDGSTSAQLEVTEAGMISLVATVESCEYSDTLEVIESIVTQFDLGADTSICIDTPLSLDFSAIGDSYLWNDGTTSPEISIGASGLYWLRITDDDCAYTDSIQISIASEDCSCNVYIPNVININSLLNNSFTPFFSCEVASYNLEIYNRWGNLIFSTEDINGAWTPSGFDDIDSGVYTYKVTYRYVDGDAIEYRVGSITLLK